MNKTIVLIDKILFYNMHDVSLLLLNISNSYY